MNIYRCIKTFTVMLEDDYPEEMTVNIGSEWETEDEEYDYPVSDLVMTKEETFKDSGTLVTWIEIDQKGLEHYFEKVEVSK